MRPAHENYHVGDVSVIVPFYNRSRFTARLLDSIARQTLKPKFIYIIDNGSRVEEIERCAEEIGSAVLEKIEVLLVSTLKRGNANYARNLGIELSSTRYIAFMDSDDWWEENHLEASLKRLQETNKAAVYGGAIVHQKIKLTKRSMDLAVFKNPFDFIFSSASTIAQSSSYVIDATRINGVLWDETLRRHQDYDFFATLHYKTTGWAFQDEPTTNIDWSEGGSKDLDYKSMVRFLLKWRHEFSGDTLKRYLWSQNLICLQRGAPPKYRNYYRAYFIKASRNKMASVLITSRGYFLLRSIVSELLEGSVRPLYAHVFLKGTRAT